MEEVKKCSQCKREIYDAKICPFCGNIIEEEIKDNNEIDTVKIICWNCGTAINKDTKVCSKCGENLSGKKCFNCGTIIEKNAKFCRKCGIDLSETSKETNLIASKISLITFFIFSISVYLAIKKGIEHKSTLIYNILAIITFIIQIYIAIRYSKNRINRVTSNFIVRGLLIVMIILLVAIFGSYIIIKGILELFGLL